MQSILTNTSALTALQNLSKTNMQLQQTQNRISTGQRISTAADNAAYWSIASTMQSDNGALSAVKDALGLGASTIDTATAALNSSKDLINQIKNKLVAATQPGIDRTSIQGDIGALQKQLKSVADSAAFSGQNWLSVDSTAVGYNATRSVVGSFTRDTAGSVSIQTIDITITSLKLYDAGTAGTATGGIFDKSRTAGTTTVATGVSGLDVSTLTDSAADITTLNNYVKIADAALKDVLAASSSLGSSQSRVTSQQSFISALMDSITKGIGTLVDADMNQESTRLQALQVQQQLGVQALSISNQNTQSIMKLFQG
jgi:flagellin